MAQWPSSGGGSGMTNPMTTAGDVIVGGVSGAPARLAKGTDTHVLTMVSGAVAWAVSASGFSNPMTTAGDIIVGGASGAAARLAKGADGRILRMVSGSVAWDTTANLLTDLGLGSIYQPLDATLTALAGVTVAADKLIYATGTDAFTTTDLSSFARTVLDDANAAAALTTLGGQPLDATLTALAGVTVAANKLIYATGADAFSTTDLSVFARTFLDDADAATVLATIGAQPLDSDLTAIAALTTTSTGRSLLAAADAAAIRTISGSFANPMTTQHDLIVGGASGAAARLAKGSDNQVLTVVSGAVAWANASSGFTNPMTTAGDIIVGGASGAAARLAKGTDGQFLSLASGTPAWVTVDTVSAPADADYFLQRNSGNNGVEYARRPFGVFFDIPDGDGTYVISPVPPGCNILINKGLAWTSTGTATVNVKIGSTSITGLSALSATTSSNSSYTSASAANVAAGGAGSTLGDQFNVTISGASGTPRVFGFIAGHYKRAT